MIKNILATVDGSAYSNAVVSQSIELARSFEARLRFLSIVDVRIFEWTIYVGSDGFMPMIPATSYQKETQKFLDEKAEEVLKRCTQKAEEASVSFTTMKVAGPPVEVICEQARVVDLVVMGRRGEYARWGDKLMGATLDGTVRQANKPILIMPKIGREIHKVLLAYDRSPQANHALQIAADFALQLHSHLVVMAVEEEVEEGNRTVQEAIDYLNPFGLQVSSRITQGSASDAILQTSDIEQVDMVVMGVHGHTRLREALLGCTTEDVLRRIERPLLLVR